MKKGKRCGINLKVIYREVLYVEKYGRSDGVVTIGGL